MEDFNKVIAFEVKKEIADRYFGFRKIIEEDSNDYQLGIEESAQSLEEKLGFSLLRIFVLLRDEDLIMRFFKMTDLPTALFFDPYVANSPTIRTKLLSDQRVHGFTRKGRFINLVLDTFQEFLIQAATYSETILKLTHDQETISEEIKLFYRKNDLSGIMLFLRNIDGDPSVTIGGSMEGAINPTNQATITEKMRIHPPEPVEDLLPIIPPLPSFKKMKKTMKILAAEAYARQPDFDPRNI